MGTLLLELNDRLASIEHLGLYLYIGWVVYLVVLGGWIILQKREPVATLSWLFALALLPYIGFVIYHVFGPQRIQRQRLKRARARLPDGTLNVGGPDEGQLPDARELAQLARATTGMGVSCARSVRLLVDGAAKYAALIEDIRAAKSHVHLEYYIYLPDESGTALRDALIDAAKRGVRVRLLLDAIGSAKCPQRFFSALEAAGGEVAWFHPTRFFRFWARPWLNLRTHRKIVVIDHIVGYVGGINVTDDEHDGLHPDTAFRDLHTRVEGDVVRALQLVFLEDWVYATGRKGFVSALSESVPPTAGGPISAQVLTSGPDAHWEPIHRLKVGLIHAATRRVWLATPYFVPGEAAMMALTSAALGGLDVRLLVPRRSDSLLVTLAARSYFDELMAAGVKIHEYGPRMLHTKALLVDDAVALMGSANFDHRSFRLNFEVAMLLQDAGVAADLARLLEHDFAAAPRVRADRARPLFRSRLPEALARLASPLL